MRTIEIDDDVFNAVELTSKLTKLSHSQILRLVIMPPNSESSSSSQLSMPQSRQGTQVNPRDKALRDLVQSPEFAAHRNVVEKFLGIFSFLHKENPDKFPTLQSLGGRKRRYIARTEQELHSSGVSVNPKKISNANFWIVTNNSTDNKKTLLRQALTLLGYGPETIRAVPESLR